MQGTELCKSLWDTVMFTSTLMGMAQKSPDFPSVKQLQEAPWLWDLHPALAF